MISHYGFIVMRDVVVLQVNTVTPSSYGARFGAGVEAVKADSQIPRRAHAVTMPFPCRPHAVPLQCRAAKGLECVFPIWFTQCDRVWSTLAIPLPCHALTMSFFSRPRHSMVVERRPVGYLHAFGFFRLSRGVPRSCYQTHTKLRCRWPVWNQTPFVMGEEKSGSSTLQKRRSVTLLD